jgi:hypothetical protein
VALDRPGQRFHQRPLDRQKFIKIRLVSKSATKPEQSGADLNHAILTIDHEVKWEKPRKLGWAGPDKVYRRRN